MTVCVGVRVNDCVVFAADSASSLVSTNAETGESQVINVFDHGDKVFNLHRGLPICAMTCGMGNIGIASIGSLAKGLRVRLMGKDAVWAINPVDYTIQDVAEKARKFLFEEKYSSLDTAPPAPHSLEFWVGGYPSVADAPHEVWKITIVNGVCGPPEAVDGPGDCGIFWGGQVAPISRLVIGLDPGFQGMLIGGGLEPPVADAIIAMLRPQLNRAMCSATMPVLDAIDLARFLVETTKQYFRFLPGANVVGGDTDIAVVTKYEGFKWISRKHFYSPALNALETDHAK